MMASGIKARLTCVDPKKLDRSFAGRSYDLALLADFPAGIDPCGENGEFHTFVSDSPDFRSFISVVAGEIVERDEFVFADVLPAGNGRSLISHVEIYVSDYAKSIRFYDKVLLPLGWERLICQKSHTTYSDGATKLVFCPVESKHLEPGFHRKRAGLNHLALYAPSKQTVDHLFETVIKPNDISCLYEKKPRGEDHYYALFFEDPDRIKIEVVYAPGYCDKAHWTNQLEDDFNPYETASV